jgi:hypothetical protein
LVVRAAWRGQRICSKIRHRKNFYGATFLSNFGTTLVLYYLKVERGAEAVDLLR